MACLVLVFGTMSVLLWWIAKVHDGKNGKPFCHLVPLVVWFGLGADLWIYIFLLLAGLGMLVYASLWLSPTEKELMEEIEKEKEELEKEEVESCDHTYYEVRNGKCADGEVRNGKIYCNRKGCGRTW